MKKYILGLLLLVSFQAFGQFSNYTNINGRYKWIAGKFDSTLTLPSGTTPSLRTGGGTGPGALFYNTADSSVYQYTGSQWIKLRGTSGVTSVGLSMPSAFTVTGSPVTGSGTLSVSGAGTAAQYVRGDGQLATLPSGSSGGSSVSYYLNGSINASVATYKQMADTAVIGAGTDFTLTSNGLIAQFLTNVGSPNRLLIPGGAWNFEMFFSVSSSGGNQKFYVELLKYNGSTFSLIASSSSNPEEITSGTVTDLYLTSLAVPTTTLLATDRLAVRVYIVDNAVGRTITLHTEDNNLCEIITTFAGGVSALNGLTANTQYFATGTAGTDFAISSLTDTHTFNLPTASATNRGALSSTDWTTFNGKVGGSGTINYVPKFTASGTIGNSAIFSTAAGRVLIGTTTESTYELDVVGDARISTELIVNNSTLSVGALRVRETSGGYGLIVQRNASASISTQINGAAIAFTNSGNSSIEGSANIIHTAFSGYHNFQVASYASGLFIANNGSVGMGTTSPHASARVDITSTTKGFLPPRMTGAQAESIATPAAGLMVYSTDGSGTTITSLGWWGYNGTTWVKIN